MNEFGDFLYNLRKEKGMTQNELASILGVTNKAVSKWETGESMPETSQLVPLSEIFGVSVDELLKGKREEKAAESAKTDDEKDDEIIKKYLFARGRDDDDDEKNPAEKIKGAACTVLFFATVITYLILGVTLSLWHPYWVLIPVGALTCGLIGCVWDASDAKKRNRKREHGENPVTGAICGSVMLSCIIAYLLLGALANLWHPYWILIVAGAALCGIIGAIGKAVDVSKKK